MFSKIEIQLCNHIKRSANGAADALARLGFERDNLVIDNCIVLAE